MLRQSMIILAKSFDLGQMIRLDLDADHLALCYTLHRTCAYGASARETFNDRLRMVWDLSSKFAEA